MNWLVALLGVGPPGLSHGTCYESSLVSLSFGMWNPLSQKPHANGLFYCSVEPESKGREVGRYRHPVSRGREAEVGPVKEKSVAEGNNNLL